MRLARARLKHASELLPVETCCDEAIRIQHESCNKELTINLDITGSGYNLHTKGHCGQELPYDRWVMAVDEKGNLLGKVPFDIIDIDEAIK